MIIILILLGILILSKVGICAVIEIDSRWFVGWHLGEYAIGLSLGFMAITIWRVPFYKVHEAIGEGAINKYMANSGSPDD